ncbi:hypothetical protein THIOSC13_1200011 [uncultured Thiomicrorhabdus sp.]
MTSNKVTVETQTLPLVMAIGLAVTTTVIEVDDEIEEVIIETNLIDIETGEVIDEEA